MTILTDQGSIVTPTTLIKFVTLPYYTPNDIVPIEHQDILTHWSDLFTIGYFNIGDLANEDVVRAAKKGFKVTQQQVFDAVGSFCRRSGRTVRYYAENAAFYPQPVRTEFDMLDFCVFNVARQFGDDWCKFLKFAQLYPGLGAEKVRRKYLACSGASSGASSSGDMPSSSLDDYAVESVMDGRTWTVSPVAPYDNTCEVSHDLPARLPQDIMQSLAAFSDIISTAEYCLARSFGLPPEVLYETTEAIATIRKHMPKIVSCIGGDSMIK